MMRRRTKQRLLVAPRQSMVVVLVSASLVLACVGGEPDSAESGEAKAGSRADSQAEPVTSEGVSFERDTTPPAPYTVFKTDVVAEQPRKVIFHFFVRGRVTRAGVSATLRAMLDSVGAADSTLAAVRAIAYAGQVTTESSRTSMRLLPVGWGAWIPPEGWDSVTAESRSGFYRTYVYSSDPGWDIPRESPDLDSEQ